MRNCILSFFVLCLSLLLWHPAAAQISPSNQVSADLANCDLEAAVIRSVFSCDGAIVCVEISGGTAPFRLFLSNNSQPISPASRVYCFNNLAPGSYTVRVLDAQNCGASVSFTVPPFDLQLQATVQHISCFGKADGAIDLEIPIDVAPIFFKWTGPGGFTADTEDIKNLKSGVYQVQVSGANSICYGVGKWEVLEPAPIKIDVAITQAVCGLAGACALIRGGTAPYRVWGFNRLPAGANNSNIDALIANLPPSATLPSPTSNTGASRYCQDSLSVGVYYIVVQDANGCRAFEIIRIDGSANFQRRVETTNVSCFGRRDGRICFKIENGTPPFKTSISSTNASSIQTIEGDSGCFEFLPAGEYALTTTDATGCTSSERVRITQPSLLEAEFTITENTCRDGASGCLKVSGGTRPYSIYAWVHPNPTANVGFEIDFYDNGLPYVVNAQRSTAFNFPPVLSATGPFCARNIPPGDYILIVVDANNCYELVVVNIPAANGLQAAFLFNNSNDRCSGANSGCLVVSGGARPYAVSVWRLRVPLPNANPDIPIRFDEQGNPILPPTLFERADSIFNLEPESPTPTAPYRRCARNIPPGNYLIVVVDAEGCYTLVQVRIPRNEGLHARFVETGSNTCEARGSGCLFVEGGTMPYEVQVWSWNSPLTVIPQVRFDDAGRPFLTGGERVEWDWQPVPAVLPYRRCARNIPPGLYYILVVDANRCYQLLPVNIRPSNGLRLETSVEHPACNTTRGGTVKISIGGGIAPYQIRFGDRSLSTRDSIVVLENIAPGSYALIVLDSLQCLTRATVVVRAGTLNTNLDYDPFGEYACVLHDGGTAPYKIEWLNLATGAVVSSDTCVRNLAAGAYLITIMDNNGCTAQELLFIDAQPCVGGTARVSPESIASGEVTTLTLIRHAGVSIQWQFKTDATPWLDIPGATTPTFQTPPIHTGISKVIYVRAKVTCANGNIVFSDETSFKVRGNSGLQVFPASVEDRELFNPAFRQAEVARLNMTNSTATTRAMLVYPTVSQSVIHIRFDDPNRAEVAQLLVLNEMGQVVHQQRLSNLYAGETTTLSVSNWTPGMYFVRMVSDTWSETQRIVVQ